MRITSIAVPILAACVSAQAGTAQVPAEAGRADPPMLVSGNLGVGVATHGFGGQLSLGLSTTAGDFVLRTTASQDLDIFTGTPDNSQDVALLYGKRVTGNRGWIRFAAGPGFAHSERRGEAQACYLFFCDYEKIVSNHLGLGLQIDAVWAASRWFGVGLGAFGNVNSGTSFFGVTANLHLGRLR